MEDIAIVGTGGLGRELCSIIENINEHERKWNILGFYDDNEIILNVNGYPLLGKISDLNDYPKPINIIVAIGKPSIKKDIILKITNVNINYPVIIHPSAQVLSKNTVHIGKGVVLSANVVLTTNIVIEPYVYINTSTVISHDTFVGAYSIVMPCVSISAKTSIGVCSYIGNGVIIDQPKQLAENSIILAGSILSY
jgi:sugar O-acyltransferase (sialic acid O-acetyltransferase NeuD family)